MSFKHQTAAAYKVQIGSSVFEQNNSGGLLNLVVEDHVDMASISTVTISTAENQPSYTFTIGDKVSITLKTDNEIFSGEVISIDHAFQGRGTSSIILRCIDNLHRLGRGRKTRFWNDKKDSDIATEVGEESKLSVECDETNETHKYILQRNESNVSFLKRLAARNDFQLRIEPGKLLFKKAEMGGQTKKINTNSGLLSLNTSFNSSEMVQEVIVRGWDITSKKEIVGKAVAADVTSIGSGTGGPKAASVFGDTTAYVTDIPVRTQEMADMIAKSEMERIARKFCRGKCMIVGDDAVRAGTMIEMTDFGVGLNGKYYVVSTRHILTPSSGYKTEVAFCSNTMGN
jgi:phage protein D